MQIPFFDVSKREALDAARLALQSAIAAAAMFLIMRYFDRPEEFVGILSAVLVVQPSAGTTIGAARDRFLATLIGSLIGIACLFALPSGYGTAAALAFSMLMMNGVAAFRPDWRYGVVAAVALALGAENEMTQTALDRGIAIGIGVLVGALTTLIVWPDSARHRARRHLHQALRAIADFLDTSVKEARGEEADDQTARTRYHTNIENARSAASAIRIADKDDDVARVELVEKVYNSVLILNRVADATDAAADETKAMREDVDTIRVAGCEIAKGITDGETDHQDRIKKIQDTLKRVRKAVEENGSSPQAKMFDYALIFGLEQVADTLEDLVSAYGEARSDDLAL